MKSLCVVDPYHKILFVGLLLCRKFWEPDVYLDVLVLGLCVDHHTSVLVFLDGDAYGAGGGDQESEEGYYCCEGGEEV